MTVHEWAEARREVPRGTSPEPGRWRSKPYQKPVLEAIGAPGIEGVVYVAASQGGAKTEILLNAIGYFIDVDPSPQIFTTYTVEMAERISKHRIAPMLRETESLRGKVKDAKTRDSGNTILDKEYDGGQVTLVGANSPGGLAGYPKRVALFDEIGRYPKSAGTEGDPIALAETRTAAYWNAVKVYCSSPGEKTEDALWPLWLSSDQSEWFARCPDCGHEHVLTWEHVRFEKDADGQFDPETARYVCPACDSIWTDAKRFAAIRAGHYLPQARFRGIKGFRLNGLSVLGRALRSIVALWKRAQGNPERLRVFKNTVLTEWSEVSDEIQDPHALARSKRVHAFPEREGEPVIPARAALLTAGVDVQDDRLEAEVVAWAPQEETWSLEYHVLYGDPATPALWLELDEMLGKPRRHELGIDTYIRAVAIDTGGHFTSSVYDFCRPRYRRTTPDGGKQYVFATKGHEGKRPIWPERASRKNKGRLPLFIVGVDTAKEIVLDRLRIEEPGPGFCHFPLDRTTEYFEQITAEVPRAKFVRGFRRVQWVKIRPANEAFDVRVLNTAALSGFRMIARVRLDRALEELRRIAGAQDPGPEDPEGGPDTPTPAPSSPPPTPAPPPRAAAPRGGGGGAWMGGRGRGWIR